MTALNLIVASPVPPIWSESLGLGSEPTLGHFVGWPSTHCFALFNPEDHCSCLLAAQFSTANSTPSPSFHYFRF